MNTVGSYDCMCNTGFEGSGFNGDCNSEFQLVTLPMTGSSTSLLLCLLADIDECALDTDNCDVNADCTDTVGSFFCTCVEGFRGNGINCTGLKYTIKYFVK